VFITIIVTTAVIGIFAVWFMLQRASIEPPTVSQNVLFVLDRSEAMKTDFAAVTKMEAVKEALVHRLETVSENVNLALRVYGGGCTEESSELVLPFTQEIGKPIQEVIESLKLQGQGVVVHAVHAATADFMDEQFRDCHNTIIFVVGSVDSCYSEAKFAYRLQSSNIDWSVLDDVRLVGIGLSEESQARIQRIATMIPDVLSLSVDDEGQLHRAIGSRKQAEVLLQAKQSFVEGKKLYENGDFDSALPFLESAARKNIATATHYVGTIYFYGRGSIAPDYERAARWYRKGAALNSSIAMFNLGVMFDPDVRLQTANLDSAKLWYERAAMSGHQEAQKRLQELEH